MKEEDYLYELSKKRIITLSIGVHGLIFMQICNGKDYMKSYNSYQEAYNYFLKSNKTK
jgi:hypothetical protein